MVRPNGEEHRTEFRKLDRKLQQIFPTFRYQAKVIQEMSAIAQNIAARFRASQHVLQEAQRGRDSVCQSLVDVERQTIEAMEEFVRLPCEVFLRNCIQLKTAETRFQQARCELIRAHLHLVASMAGTYSNRGLPLPKLARHGVLGLLRAVKKFDYRHEWNFSHLCRMLDSTKHACCAGSAAAPRARASALGRWRSWNQALPSQLPAVERSAPNSQKPFTQKDTRMNTDRTREILRKVRQIEVRTNRLVNDALAGEYHSVFKGRGMDFDEVREYVPGDEVRAIDWNVTARAGRPFVKKFTEERELTLLLAVDVSASGNFGSGEQSKRELAAELASVLAFSAIRNSDKVGLVLFTDGIEQYIPPKKGRQHVLRVVREILYFQPRHRGTDLVKALDFVNQVTKRRAVVFLVSDFQSAGDREAALVQLRRALRQTNRRHDLVAMHIADPHEAGLPNVGILAVEDAETGELVELDTGTPEVRARFQEAARDHVQRLERTLAGEAVDSLDLSTTEPYLPALMRFFKFRESRRR